MSRPDERQALISPLEGMLSPTWQRPSGHDDTSTTTATTAARSFEASRGDPTTSTELRRIVGTMTEALSQGPPP